MTGPVLAVKDLVAGYGGADILRGASVEVNPQELVCIIGPNGAGKSTLLRCIVGLLRPRSGSITLDGSDITKLPTEKIIAAGVSYVPQVGNVFPTLTVRENLEMGLFLQPQGIEAALGRVHEVFPLLRERAPDRVSRLSGGQRQMVAIGRALMPQPKVLLLDEPTAGLAPQLQDQVLDRARSIAQSGIPIVMVEQNARKGLARADRAYIFEQGRNKHEAKGSDLLADENLGRLYLGGAATP